jgi:hypothetical protein
LPMPTYRRGQKIIFTAAQLVTHPMKAVMVGTVRKRRTRSDTASDLSYFFFFLAATPAGFFLPGLLSLTTASGRGSFRFLAGPNMR